MDRDHRGWEVVPVTALDVAALAVAGLSVTSIGALIVLARVSSRASGFPDSPARTLRDVRSRDRSGPVPVPEVQSRTEVLDPVLVDQAHDDGDLLAVALAAGVVRPSRVELSGPPPVRDDVGAVGSPDGPPAVVLSVRVDLHPDGDTTVDWSYHPLAAESAPAPEVQARAVGDLLQHAATLTVRDAS